MTTKAPDLQETRERLRVKIRDLDVKIATQQGNMDVGGFDAIENLKESRQLLADALALLTPGR